MCLYMHANSKLRKERFLFENQFEIMPWSLTIEVIYLLGRLLVRYRENKKRLAYCLGA